MPRATTPKRKKAPLRRRVTVWQLIAALVGAATLCAGLVILVKPDAFRTAAPAAVDNGLVSTLASHREFTDWVQAWAGVDEYLKAGEFTLSTSLPLATATVAGAMTPAEAESPRAGRWITSPSRVQTADLLANFGTADATVQISRFGGPFVEVGRRVRPGYFQAGFWLDETTFVAMGTTAERRDNGEPLCIAVAGGAPTCLYRLTLDVFDFAVQHHDTYVSEKHGLASDPFREALRQRWEASLTADERLAAGLVGQEFVAEAVEGEITSLAENGFTMTSGGAQAVEQSVLIHARTTVSDEQFSVVGAAFLRPHMTVNVTGYRDSTGRLIAAQVTALKAPRLTVAGVPDDALFPAAGLTLKGEVRQGVKSLAIKLKSRRTGTVLSALEVVFNANDEPWQQFTVHLTPVTALRAGEPLTLAIFDPTDLETGETYRLTAAKP
jgi:hypothetical protein